MATPSIIAVWPSWPQACITPGFFDAKGSPVSSVIGSASWSLRSATVGPGRPPRRSARTLVAVGCEISKPPISSSCSRMKREVSVSW